MPELSDKSYAVPSAPSAPNIGGGRFSIPKYTDPYASVSKSVASNGISPSSGLAALKAPKAPTKAQQKAAHDQYVNAFASQAALDIQNVFANNSEYQNGSLTRKENMLKDYTENVFPTYLNSNPQLQADPELKHRVNLAVSNYLANESKKLKDQRSWGNTIEALAMSFGKGVDDLIDNALNVYYSLGSDDSQNNASANAGSGLVDPNANWNQGIAPLNPTANGLNAQGNGFNPVNIVPDGAWSQASVGLDPSVVNKTPQTNQSTAQTSGDVIKGAKALVESLRKSAKNEEERIASNPVYADQRMREHELDEMYGKDRWGLQGHHSFALTATDWILTNAPQIGISVAGALAGMAAGGTAGGAVGGPGGAVAGAALGARTGLALTGAFQSIGGVGQQIVADVMDASDDTLKTLPEYNKLLSNLKNRIPDEAERKDTAKMLLAMNAVKEAAPGAATIGAVLSQIGPEAIIAKTGLIKSLEGKGILKRLGRGTVGAAGQGLEEVVEGAESKAATNKALNQNDSWFDGWRQNAVQGAVVGHAYASLAGSKTSTTETTTGTNTEQQVVQDSNATGATASGDLTADNVDTVINVNNPFYNPDASKATLNEVMQDDNMGALRTAVQNISETIAATNPDEAPKFNDNDILTITRVLTDLANSETEAGRPNDGAYAVDSFIKSFNKNTNLNWTFEDFKSRSVDILTRQISDAQAKLQDSTQVNEQVNEQAKPQVSSQVNSQVNEQPPVIDTTATIQETNTNGTDNTRTSPGIATSFSTATTNQQGYRTPYGEQSLASVVGSDQATQGTGNGWTSYESTRATSTPLYSSQSEITSGERANSGSNYSVTYPEGTQSDLGARGSIGTSEQRTGNGNNPEATGTSQQSSDPVEALRQAETKNAMDILAKGQETARQPVLNAETNTAVDRYLAQKDYSQSELNDTTNEAVKDYLASRGYSQSQIADIVSEAFTNNLPPEEAKAITRANSALRDQITHTYGSVKYEVAQAKVYSKFSKELGNGTNALMATQMYMGMALSVGNIVCHKIIDKLPVFGARKRALERGTYARDLQSIGTRSFVLLTSNADKANTNPENFNKTLTPAVIRDFVEYTLDHLSVIHAEARDGNVQAVKFLQDFKAFARACGIEQGREFSSDAWLGNSKYRGPGLGLEHALPALEYFVTDSNTETNSKVDTELVSLLRGTLKDLGQRIRDFYNSVKTTIMGYIHAVARVLQDPKRWANVSFRKLFSKAENAEVFVEPKSNETIDNVESNDVKLLTYKDPQMFRYSQADYLYLNFDFPKEQRAFLSSVIGNFDVRDVWTELQSGNNERRGDLVYAGTIADSYLQMTALTGYMLNTGKNIWDAVREAASRVHETMEIINGKDPVVILTDHRKQALTNQIKQDPIKAMTWSMDMNATSPYVTAAMTTDNDLYNQASGLYTPAQIAVLDSNSNTDDAAQGTSNASNIDGVLELEEEIQAIEATIADLEKELDAGAIADTPEQVGPTTEFVATYGDGDIIHDETGTAVRVYRDDNVVRMRPTGADLEMPTYVAVHNPISDVKEFDKILENKDLPADFNKDAHDVLVNFFKSVQFSIEHDRPIDFQDFAKQVAEALPQWNIDSNAFQFKDKNGEPVYFIFDVRQAEDMFTVLNALEQDTADNNSTNNTADVADTSATNNTDLSLLDDIQRNNSNSFVESPRRGLTELENKTVDAIMAIANRYGKTETAVREEVSLANADMYSTAMTGSQNSNAWMRATTRIRAIFGDAYAAYRRFVVENFTPKQGSVDSAPMYQAFVMARNRVRGAKVELQEQILRPLQQWIAKVAQDRDVEPQALAQKMGQLYTYMHILEAARKQEQQLQRAVIEARMKESAGEEDSGLAKAQQALQEYYDFQDDPTTAKPVNIYGGVTVKDARAGMQAIMNELGDELSEEAVGKFQKAWADITNYQIEHGALSQQDVRSLGAWSYYCALVTKTAYDNTAANDMISLFPSKLNYYRAGSLDPAVDAFTSLNYMISRTANNVGSFDLGRETAAGYRILADRYHQGLDNESGTSLPESNNNVRRKHERITNTLAIDYYNGMGMVSAKALHAIVDADNVSSDVRAHAQAILDNCDLLVRVNERTADGNLQESVPYVIIFDKSDPNVADVKKAFSSPFKIDVPQKNWINTLDRGLTKATSAYAQLNTTFRPWFPPVNAVRDFIERTYYSMGKSYRAADGSTIAGSTITARMTVATKYTPDILKAVFTGKTDLDGKIGQYLTEFKKQGIMTSASLRGMLEHTADNTLVYIQKAIEQAEKGASLKETSKKLLKAGKAPFRLWAEMMYSVPTVTMFIALRESNVNAKDAAFYVTEMMNLSQRGEVTNVLARAYPFIASIGQTSIQLTNFFGLNIGTFGTTRNVKNDKETRKNLARAWALFGGTTIVTLMLLPLIAAGLGGDDDDEDKGYKILDNMSLDSFTFLPIPIGKQDYVKFPLGFGPTPFAVQVAIGVDRMFRGADTPGHVAMNLIDSYIRNVSPLAGPQFEAHSASDFMKKMLMTVTPAIVQPIANTFGYNKTYFGSEIVNQKYINEYDRLADIDRDSTARGYKDFAKAMADFGIDFAPEQWKEVISGYATGPLAGILQAVVDDPLAKDPAYASLRDELGPMFTALGASMSFGSVGNTEQNLFYNYKNTYDNLILSTGLSSVWKLTDNDKSAGISAGQKRQQVLLDAGFDPLIVQDYITLYDVEKRLMQTSKKWHARIKDDYANNAPISILQDDYNMMRQERTLIIQDALPEINLHNGTLKRADLSTPSMEQIRIVRGR